MKKRIPSNEGKWSVFPKIITIIIMHANVHAKMQRLFTVASTTSIQIILFHPRLKSQPKPTKNMPQKTLQMFEQKSRSRKHKAGNIPPNSKSETFQLNTKHIGTLSSFKKQTKDKKDRQTDMAAFVLFRSNKSLNDLQK